VGVSDRPTSGHPQAAGIVKLPALVFNDRMNMPTIQPLSYSGYRFPAVIISHCTWLYFRFALSYRDVAEMMAERGVTVSYETIREWSQKFGGTESCSAQVA
jgi:transposase-like protein